MKVVFRTDATGKIGTGHVVRCRTLAEALRERGAEISFVCRDEEGIAASILGPAFEILLLPEERRRDDRAKQLKQYDLPGVAEEIDAHQTIEAIQKYRPDWLVVDHYALSAEWEKTLRPHAHAMLAIDDIGRPHDVTALLDQNFSLQAEARYENKLAPSTRTLLGPTYALLQSHYTAAIARTRARDAKVEHIVVFFGGAETEMTILTINALSRQEFEKIQLDIVVGKANPNADAIAERARERPLTNVHRNLPSLANLLASADLAIGAGGGNTWERCYLGLPTIVIAVAENQIPAHRDLAAAGITEYLGPQETADEDKLAAAVRHLIAEPKRRLEMSERSRALVDGYGALRIAEVLAPTSVEQMRLRPAAIGDREFTFRLANDPLVRSQSFSTNAISWDRHKAWYADRLNNPACHYFILEAGALPIGQIRFDLGNGTAVLSYALDPVARGRRLGLNLVKQGLGCLRHIALCDIFAEVKPENRASRAVFESLGFDAQSPAGDKILYTLPADRLKSLADLH